MLEFMDYFLIVCLSAVYIGVIISIIMDVMKVLFIDYPDNYYEDDDYIIYEDYYYDEEDEKDIYLY